jgi:hypothetical protein
LPNHIAELASGAVVARVHAFLVLKATSRAVETKSVTGWGVFALFAFVARAITACLFTHTSCATKFTLSTLITLAARSFANFVTKLALWAPIAGV